MGFYLDVLPLHLLKKYQNQVHWFTGLLSKKDNLPKIKLFLKKAQASQVKVVNMAQGQKTSRFIAWRFAKNNTNQGIAVQPTNYALA